jgi:hypothetical protein
VAIGLDGRPGDLALDLPADRRFATLWITAVAVDGDGRASGQVATPAEVRVINPPPPLTPTAPYPEREGPAATRGLTAPAGLDGLAAVALAWDPLPGPYGAAARFELGRALDRSVVAADRSRWLRGGGDAHFAAAGVVAGPAVTGILAGGWTAAGDGFVVAVAGPAEGLPALAGGRIAITHRIGDDAITLHHRLLRVSMGSGTVRLLCRPQVDPAGLGEIEPGAPFRAEAEPDYTATLADDMRLRVLADAGDPADSNAVAFGIVTGTPVAARRFVDRVPGRGAGRFLYKLRAVFPAEARSAWSQSSVPVAAPDLTPAPAPRLRQSTRDGATTRHVVEIATGLDRIGLLQEVDGALQPLCELAVSELAPAPLRVRDGRVDLAPVAPGRLSTDTAPRLLGVFDAGVDRAAPPAAANLLTGARLVREVVEPPAGSVAEGQRVVARIAPVGGGEIWVEHLPGLHEIELADPAGAAAAAVWVQALRVARVGDREVRCDSAPVLLRAGRPANG